MKFSESWLRSHVPTTASRDELSAVLTAIGLEVEEVTALGDGLDNVVVARIVEAVRHPEADRLQVCKVDAGTFAACTSPLSLGLARGPHTFTVEAADTSGNVGSASHSWTVNGPPENVVVTPDAGAINEGGSKQITITFTDAFDSGPHSAVVDWGDGTTTPLASVTSGFTQSHTYAQDGNFTVTVTITDALELSASGTGPVAAIFWP